MCVYFVFPSFFPNVFLHDAVILYKELNDHFVVVFVSKNMILIGNIVRAGHIYQTKTKVPNIQINKQQQQR